MVVPSVASTPSVHADSPRKLVLGPHVTAHREVPLAIDTTNHGRPGHGSGSRRDRLEQIPEFRWQETPFVAQWFCDEEIADGVEINILLKQPREGIS